MPSFYSIILSIILLFSGQINVVAQTKSLNCTSNNDCDSSYTCVSSFCQLSDSFSTRDDHILAGSDTTACPRHTCTRTATCEVENGGYVCYCRGEVVSSTSNCWLEAAFVGTIVVFLVLCLFPVLSIVLIHRCEPSRGSKGGKKGGQGGSMKQGAEKAEDTWEDYGLRALFWTPMFETEQGNDKQGNEKQSRGDHDRDLEKSDFANDKEKEGLIADQKFNGKGSKKQLNTTDLEQGGKNGNQSENQPLARLESAKGKPMDTSEADKPPFFPENRKELPQWIPKCCRCRCLESFLSLPYKMMFAIFSIICDFFNMAASLYLFVSERSQFIETHDYAYLFITADGIIMFFCEFLVVLTAFHKVQHPEINHWCIYPAHYKFWMVVFYFPNMCALSPFVGVLKAWYTLGDTGYSVYYFATGFQQSGSTIAKILALCLRVPYACSQFVMLVTVFRKRWKMDHRVALTGEEWYQVFAQAMKSWKENVPNIMDILIAKYKYTHGGKSPKDTGKK